MTNEEEFELHLNPSSCPKCFGLTFYRWTKLSPCRDEYLYGFSVCDCPLAKVASKRVFKIDSLAGILEESDGDEVTQYRLI